MDNNSVTTASAELLLLTHYSPRSQYIKVITSTEQPTVGEYIIFEITTNFYVKEFHYMILSKNVIIHTERESLTNGGAKTIALVVGIEMAPVAEIFVWTVTWQGEVVSDSLSFPVIGMFVNNLAFVIRNSARATKHNEFLYEVSLDGKPGSYVTLSGITKEAYQMQANSSHLNYLTVISKMLAIDKNIDKIRQHIWLADRKELQQYDGTFYSASSNGIDVSNTFLQSGLITFTDGTLPLCSTFFKRCDWPSCCRFGSELPSAITNLSQKATRISERNATVNDFKKFRTNRLSRHYKGVIWFWQDIQIASDGHASFYTKGPPTDIDGWLINGQSTNSEKGIGIAEEVVKFDVKEPFVANVIMPQFCRLYEFIDIQINILHRRKATILATIILRNSSDYSLANGHQRFPISLKLSANERHTIHIPIIVESSGKILINIHIETAYGFSNITRTLNVENLAIEDIDHRHRNFRLFNSLFLNLTDQQNYIVKYINITKSSILRWAAYSLGAESFESLLCNAIALECQRYSGTAQDYVFAFAAHFYRLIYTRFTNNESQNVTAVKELYQNINRNYQILLSFLRSDGSFPQLHDIDSNQLNSSVWLTSYCLRLFQEFNSYKMIDYIWIDSSVTEKILIWLLDHQTSEGNWLSSSADSVHSTESDLTLTAHVLITLDSMKNFNLSVMTRIERTKLKAIAWIEKKMIYEGRIKIRTYDMTIITYALLLHKSSLSSKVFSALQALEKRNIVYANLYWISSESTNKSELKFECYDSLSIEITAYALHSYLIRNEPDAVLIKNWLILNTLKNDCWKRLSKRALNAAIFALLQFSIYNPERESTEIAIELNSVTMPEAQKYTLFLNRANVSQMQNVEFFDVGGKIKISAKGVGYAILQVYHVNDEKKYAVNNNDDNDNDDKDKKEYDNMPHLQFPPAFLVRNNVVCRDQFCSRISYTNCIKWSSPMQLRKHSDMSILAVTIPSGYRMQQQQLNSYVLSGMAKNLIKAKFVETKILFYFAKITEKEICVKFSIRRWYPVTNFTRLLPIRIYEYNSAENFVESIIEAAPSAIHKFDICAVCGNTNCTNCQYRSTANKIRLINWIILGFIFCNLLSFKQSCLNI